MDGKFSILNWNIGGAKYIQEEENQREKTRKLINSELCSLIRRFDNPDVITLQEIVRYGPSSKDANEIIDSISGYHYYPMPLIDSDRLSSKAKWNKVRELGGWSPDTFFAQGNAILIKDDLPHFPIWDLASSSEHKPKESRHFIEQVNLESGLYFGDRDSEPRAALVAHFIFNPNKKKTKPLDVFVVNVHLTTIMMEREGIPEIDLSATKIRLDQLDVIFRGIVSRYNKWKRQGFPQRGKPRDMKDFETYDRYEPVWILAGDFNFTPESEEYQLIKRLNFIDAVPHKGSGTKAKGAGNRATLTLDYIFVGPKFLAFDPIFTANEIQNNSVDSRTKSSDHFPLFAEIPFSFPKD